MEPPHTLPARLYLLACDQRTGRLTSRCEIGYALRAAALADLLLDGRLADEKGKVRRVEEAGRPDDPFLEEMVQRIGRSRPRSWKHWVRKGGSKDIRTVRDLLAKGGWIRVEERRVLGIFPVTRITVRDPRMVKQLKAALSAALRGTRPAARTERRDAALVALAAAGKLGHVLDRQQRRAHKARIAELTELTGPVPRALRKVIQEAGSAAAYSA